MNADRRPIPQLAPHYEISKSGDLYSVRLGRQILHVHDAAGLPFIEVQIDNRRHQLGIAQAVMAAWGDTSQLLPIQKLWFDREQLELFQHVYATFQPPKRWGRRLKPGYLSAIGKRGLFQVGRRIVKEDRLPGHEGEWALSPRDTEFGFDACPLSYLVELEPAPPGAGKYVPAALKP